MAVCCYQERNHPDDDAKDHPFYLPPLSTRSLPLWSRRIRAHTHISPLSPTPGPRGAQVQITLMSRCGEWKMAMDRVVLDEGVEQGMSFLHHVFQEIQ